MKCVAMVFQFSPRSSYWPLLLGFCFSLLPAGQYALAADNSFQTGAGRIFEQRCVRCHSHEHSKGGLSFSSAAEFFRGGESGSPISREQPEQSLLLDMISGSDPQMPAEGPALSAAEVELIRQWINAGSAWPDGLTLVERTSAGGDWWAFQPLSHPPVPKVQHSEWPRNELDHFLLAKLEEAGLSPSAEADRRTLIRRLTYDLLGLPPTREEVAAFVSDPDPQAYEKLVDRLLESPHYGERWARHWLDIVHYADTHGFERDRRRDHAWPYRDYVIRALNADRPYNEFLREQIAGDVIRPLDAEAITATGFLAAGPWDLVGQVETGSPTLKRAARADDLDDMVTQVMAVSMGLTVNCARCHDHKLDPILQKEYYQLWSVFAGVRRGDRNRDPVQARELDRLKRDLEEEQARLRAERARLQGAGIDLADLVGGGNGQGTGSKQHGIDPLSGESVLVQRAFLKGGARNDYHLSPLRFIDGVVIPDASAEGTPISSTDIRVREVSKTSGEAWDAIRNGPIHAQHSTSLGGTDFNSGEHSLLMLHANAAITFDLAEIRQTTGGEDLIFRAQVGYFGLTPQDGASVAVYVDGGVQSAYPGLGRDDGLKAIDIPLPQFARFLTLMATDNGNGIAHDQIGFTDPQLLPARLQQLNETQTEQLAFLNRRLAEVEQALQELPAAEQVYGVLSESAPPVHVLHRGNPEEPLDPVQPGALSCLKMLDDASIRNAVDEGSRRLALAEWVTHPENPLTPRVIVNRLWHHHFGVGLVDTPSDFGFGGGRPSHPELLDWLAVWLPRHNWSLKDLHRFICTSATYRQQSQATGKEAVQLDTENRWLWRMNPRRLDAESIWDSTLAVTGKWNPQMFGPGFQDFQYRDEYAPVYTHITADRPELWRRAIYRFVVRTTPHQFLTTLDCPDPANMTPVRNVTTTALQSLALLNNEFMLQQAGFLAERVRAQAPNDPAGQVTELFQLTFARDPRPEESAAALQLLQQSDLPQLCRMILNSNEFVHID